MDDDRARGDLREVILSQGGQGSLQTRRFHGARGIELVADVGGDPAAPSVIFTHGGGQTRHSWNSAVKALIDAGFYVISLDARGHGDSAWAPDGDYQLPALAADLEAVMATLQRPPVLVGASMGGATCLYLAGAVDRPAVRAVVLVDVVPRIEVAGADRIIAFMRRHADGFATLDDAADAVAAYNPNRPRPRDPEGLKKNLRRSADGRWNWHWDPAFVDRPFNAEPPLFVEALTTACTRVAIPVLLIRGLQSDIVSDEGVAHAKRCLPQLQVFDVPGAGHMVAGDRNDVFNEAVIGFLHRLA